MPLIIRYFFNTVACTTRKWKFACGWFYQTASVYHSDSLYFLREQAIAEIQGRRVATDLTYDENENSVQCLLQS